MVIVGAKGLAKELLSVLTWNGNASNICFFDNINLDTPDLLFEKYPVFKSWEKLEKHLLKTPEFALGVGGAVTRLKLSLKISKLGGQLHSVISKQALIGKYGNRIGNGVFIAPQTIITADAFVGDGTLVNIGVTIGHDSKIGKYCELSPGARILGRAAIGDFTEVGTNAVILPDKKVGSNCVIGAGAVVTKNVPDNWVVVGIPAKKMTERKPIKFEDGFKI